MSMTNTAQPDNNLFSLLGELKLSIGDFADAVKEQKKQRFDPHAAKQPRWIDVIGSDIANSNGIAVITFSNNVDMGTFWYVRGIKVGGVDPSVTATGRADIYRTSVNTRTVTSISQLGMLGWEDYTTTLPNRANYAEGELVVTQNERLIAVITNGLVAQEYVATARVQVWQEAAYALGQV